jgi:glucose/arabinose dehydrogenase
MRYACSIGALLIALLLLSSCGGGGSGSLMPAPSPGQPFSPPAVRLTEITNGFTQPVAMDAAADGRIFIVEQPGRIQLVRNGTKNGVPFLDIVSRVESGGEEGLLGIALHPQFASNRRYYVNYTRRVSGQLQSVIAEYTASILNSDTTDPATERILITVDQPFGNHKAGQLAFGPDNRLYIALGDGGGEGDPQGNGQNPNTLLGKILRIDVDSGVPFGIPGDNPFALGGGRPEIFAIGFRNPWRFSFDMPTSRLFAGDVGQSTREEVDIVNRGGNYGWNTMEGTFCFNPPSGCNQSGLTLPIFDYGRSDGNTVIGGFVYRGSAIPSLVGRYVFTDFGNGTLRVLTENAGSWTRSDLLATGRAISSFGRDAQNELYVLDYGGSLLKLSPQ